jgi:hypothetical protein
MASTARNERARVSPATDETAALRRATIDAEIAQMCELVEAASTNPNIGWMKARLDRLIAQREALAAPEAPAQPADDEMPDLAMVPSYLREIVRRDYEQRAAERAAKEWQAYADVALAHHRAEQAAPLMGNMARGPDGRLNLRHPPALTRFVSTTLADFGAPAMGNMARRPAGIISTPEERHAAAVREVRKRDAASGVMPLGGPAGD